VEVSALKYSGGIGLHGRSPLLRLQSDDRLIVLLRRGNMAAFEVLVSRYESRLMAFCRHLLGSREDAEDVLQEVLTAAFNAILADDRPINVRPWLYRIARNRSLNHLRRMQAIGVDSMDHHLSEHGATTADKVHEREEFRLLVGDIHDLPETQKTALVLREMDALSYEQIAEAMETTVPSVKSLLVRARVSLAEAAEARLLSCDEVRIELAEVAEGLQRRPSALVRRHMRSCKRCNEFRGQLKATNKALAALLPVGPLAMLHKLAFLHLGHSAGAGSSAAGAGSTAGAASGAAAGGMGAVGAGSVVAGSSALAGSSGFVSAGIGAFAGKAAAGLAAAALVTAGAVEADHSGPRHAANPPVAAAPVAMARSQTPSVPYAPSAPPSVEQRSSSVPRPSKPAAPKDAANAKNAAQAANAAKAAKAHTDAATASGTKKAGTAGSAAGSAAMTPAQPAPRTATQSDPTVLPYPGSTTTSPGTTTTASSGGAAVDPTSATTASTGSSTTTASTSSAPPPSTTSTGTSTGTTTTTTPGDGSTTTSGGDGTTTPGGTSTTPTGSSTTPTTPGNGQQPTGNGQTGTTGSSGPSNNPSPSAPNARGFFGRPVW
jgi:RNA polymerase sigma factor (sigma-70 family)